MTLLGLILVFNLFGSADLVAALSRPWPWWLKSPAADYPLTHRILGAVFVVMGLAFIALDLGLLR